LWNSLRSLSGAEYTGEAQEQDDKIEEERFRQDIEKRPATTYASLDENPKPYMFNNIGYELAVANKMLPQALKYAERAVRDTEESLQKVTLSELHQDDLGSVTSLAFYWDTLGWVHFRMNNLAMAEKYLNASWILSQRQVIGDHLGQVYEKQGKRQAAVHIYKLALAASSPTAIPRERLDELRKRVTSLGGSVPNQVLGFYPGGDELSRMRTIKLSLLSKKNANAEFFFMVGPGSKVEEVKFITGSDELKSATKVLSALTVDQPFPGNSPTHVVRRGMVGCYVSTGCSLVLLPPDSVRSVN
jgi:tetratricopeptide (TPR) repeat protein